MNIQDTIEVTARAIRNKANTTRFTPKIIYDTWDEIARNDKRSVAGKFYYSATETQAHKVVAYLLMCK